MLRSPVLIGIIVLGMSSAVFGGESCSMMGGICRERCGAGEKPEEGAFMDCGDKEDCCITDRSSQTPHCCIEAAVTKESGKSRCSAPVNGVCRSGTASPLPCDSLPPCR